MKKALLLACIGMLSIQEIQSGSNLPQGSYLQSCSDCVMEGSKLICTCDAGTYHYRTIYRKTSINASQCVSGSITNSGGCLTCTPIIQGSYLTSCSYCYIHGSHLTCWCYEPTEGIYINKTIDISKCASGTVTNEPSGLTCLTPAQVQQQEALAAAKLKQEAAANVRNTFSAL